MSLLTSLIFLASATSSPAAAPAQAETAAPAPVAGRYAPLRGRDCLDPSAARGWQPGPDRTLLVDAGRRKYRLVLDDHCLDLSVSPALVFDGDAVSNRICGSIGDRIRLERETCRIQRVELLDDAAWKAAIAQPRGRAKVSTGIE